MQPFTIDRPASLAAATALRPPAEFIAGGTDMMQLIKEDVRRPPALADLLGLLPDHIEIADATLRIGAGATMEQVATHPQVREHAPAVARALLESASVQVRNMATMGGNLLQRTRCGYYRDASAPGCNKRAPGTGCSAIRGENRMLAVLGVSEHCIASHPSDLAVALVAFDAAVLLEGSAGRRRLPLDELYRLPDERPDLETQLHPGEVITGIELPISAATRRSVYLKVRDRASFEWALMSAAVGLDIDSGRIRAAHVAMGGVGTKPWRLASVEAALAGRAPDAECFAQAAARSPEGAITYGRNDFKRELMPRVLGRALALAAGGDDA